MNRTLQLRSRPSIAPVLVEPERAAPARGSSCALRLAAGIATACVVAQGAQALNPQPLPPRVAVFGQASRVALNPQPLPPRLAIRSELSRVALNPQPLPPRIGATTDLSRVALNPQPLPPRVAITSDVSRVALNPQPLPPRQVAVPGAVRQLFVR